MSPIWISAFAALLLIINVSGVLADGLIVYGDTWAMTIAEPPGWIGDTEAGASLGLNIVLYPEGSRWTDGNAYIYGMALAIKPADIKRQRKEDRRLNEEHFGKDIRWHDIDIQKPYSAGQVYAAAEMYAKSYEKMVWIGDEKSKGVALFVLNARDGKRPNKNVLDAFEKVLKSVVLMQKM
ncbi:MAG: hypothetical protein WC969_04775 [Elusimicrobiota bacterium]